MAGGVQEALFTLEFAGRDRDNAKTVRVSSPSLIYEAEISQDINLSYAWLAEHGFDVCLKRHGLQGIVGEEWCGCLEIPRQRPHTLPPSTLYPTLNYSQ